MCTSPRQQYSFGAPVLTLTSSPAVVEDVTCPLASYGTGTATHAREGIDRTESIVSGKQAAVLSGCPKTSGLNRHVAASQSLTDSNPAFFLALSATAAAAAVGAVVS